jgi:hypothetical protein
MRAEIASDLDLPLSVAMVVVVCGAEPSGKNKVTKSQEKRVNE